MTKCKNISERFTVEQLSTLSYDAYRSYIDKVINVYEFLTIHEHLEAIQKIDDIACKRIERKLKKEKVE